MSDHLPISRPRWAWLLWVQLAVVLLATLAAYRGLLNLAILTWPGVDKLLHFTLYGALAFTAVGWWADRSPRLVLAILCGLAILEEAAQALSAARTCSAVDLAATLLGILVLGSVAGWRVHKGRRLPGRRRDSLNRSLPVPGRHRRHAARRPPDASNSPRSARTRPG